MPKTYGDLVADILANQNPETPAFRSEREVREWLAETYPSLERNWDALRLMAGANPRMAETFGAMAKRVTDKANNA